jgi:hypothetical protein
MAYFLYLVDFFYCRVNSGLMRAFRLNNVLHPLLIFFHTHHIFKGTCNLMGVPGFHSCRSQHLLALTAVQLFCLAAVMQYHKQFALLFVRKSVRSVTGSERMIWPVLEHFLFFCLCVLFACALYACLNGLTMCFNLAVFIHRK